MDTLASILVSRAAATSKGLQRGALTLFYLDLDCFPMEVRRCRNLENTTLSVPTSLKGRRPPLFDVSACSIFSKLRRCFLITTKDYEQ
jgi:hypothetical protein